VVILVMPSDIIMPTVATNLEQTGSSFAEALPFIGLTVWWRCCHARVSSLPPPCAAGDAEGPGLDARLGVGGQRDRLRHLVVLILA
jgi:hypothetical protein